MHDHAQRHPGRRQHTGPRAEVDDDRGDVGVVRSRGHDHQQDGDQETGQHRRVEHDVLPGNEFGVGGSPGAALLTSRSGLHRAGSGTLSRPVRRLIPPRSRC